MLRVERGLKLSFLVAREVLSHLFALELRQRLELVVFDQPLHFFDFKPRNPVFLLFFLANFFELFDSLFLGRDIILPSLQIFFVNFFLIFDFIFKVPSGIFELVYVFLSRLVVNHDFKLSCFVELGLRQVFLRSNLGNLLFEYVIFVLKYFKHIELSSPGLAVFLLHLLTPLDLFLPHP